MEVAVAVAGIIRQQACGLRVWCPEEEEEEAATRSHEAGIQPASSLLLSDSVGLLGPGRVAFTRLSQ